MQIKCPGSIIEGADPSPHMSQYSTVQWFLDDADGFKQYLNDTSGVNLDDLLANGTFYVSKLGKPLANNEYI
jgi:hypothetical protein